MKLFTIKEVAKKLGLKPGTVYAWRCNGRGPKFVEIEGNPRCREDDLNQYILEQTGKPVPKE